MSSKLLLQAQLLVALLFCANSVPYHGEQNIRPESSHVSGRHKGRQIYQQHPLNRFQCSEQRDCYPPRLSTDTIPTKYITCSDNVCMCYDCFVLINDTCEVAECHSYDLNTNQCVDNRKSQKDVVLLSIFLSSVGAANFYIGQNVLGAVQLAIFVVLLLSLCSFVCIPCCALAICDDAFENFLQTYCFICLLILAISVVVCCFVAVVGWWAADLVTLIQNGRSAGDGCPLRPDL